MVKPLEWPQPMIMIMIMVIHLASNQEQKVSLLLPGADSGFFLGGGAPLRNGVTDWWPDVNASRIGKPQVISGGVHTPCNLPLPLPLAAQDLCIKTNYYRNKILKDGTDPMCRICGQFQETVDHLVSGCLKLAKTEYIQRHNKAAAYLHWTVCKHYNIKAQDKHYEHAWTSYYCDRIPNNDYTLGHANPNWQR